MTEFVRDNYREMSNVTNQETLFSFLEVTLSILITKEAQGWKLPLQIIFGVVKWTR